MPQSKKVLLVGAGGGNDSFSSLLLLNQIQKDLSFTVSHLDIAAMMPSCLSYQNVRPTADCGLFELSSNSTRFADFKELKAFPEKVLCQLKDRVGFPLQKVFGVSMSKGSEGVLNAFRYLLGSFNYDLIVVADVGGDFIALDSNTAVLSPQMDGYVGWAFKQLEKEYPVIYGVFGLATDGESTSEMISQSLQAGAALKITEGVIDKEDVQFKNLQELYRKHVEPNRYSRTTDFTLKEITGEHHENPSKFRCRLHVKNSLESTDKFYAYFEHHHDPVYYGKYYLFSSLEFVNNRFCTHCANSLDWILQVHRYPEKVNHELCGQYEDGIYYCLPSYRFTQEQRDQIVDKALKAVAQGFYENAVFYKEDLKEKSLTSFEIKDLNSNLSFVLKSA